MQGVDKAELIYANRTHHVAQSKMEHLPNYYRMTVSTVRPYIRGVVADIGCGSGMALPFYADLADSIHAIDHNEELLRRLRQGPFGDRVIAQQCDLLSQDDWDSLPDQGFDTAILMDVLEHFEDDAGFLNQLAPKMRPNGHVIVKVPAHSDYYGAADRASGHFRRYDRSDAERLAAATPFELARLKEINRFGGLIYRHLRHNDSNFSSNFSSAKLGLANSLIRPIFWMDHLIPARGLSQIMIFRT